MADEERKSTLFEKADFDILAEKGGDKKLIKKLKDKYDRIILELEGENKILKNSLGGITSGKLLESIRAAQEKKEEPAPQPKEAAPVQHAPAPTPVSHDDKKLREEAAKNAAKVEELKKKITELEEKVKDADIQVAKYKNEYYKAFADTTNLRNTIKKENEEAKKYRAEGFIEDLTPILDNFYFALATEAKTEEIKNYQVGFSFIYKNMVNVLSAEGLTVIAPKIGDKFDAAIMEAVESQPARTSGYKPNSVVKVMAQGYKFIDHLLAPAKVVVAVDSKESVDNIMVEDDIPGEPIVEVPVDENANDPSKN